MKRKWKQNNMTVEKIQKAGPKKKIYKKISHGSMHFTWERTVGTCICQKLILDSARDHILQ